MSVYNRPTTVAPSGANGTYKICTRNADVIVVIVERLPRMRLIACPDAYIG